MTPISSLPSPPPGGRLPGGRPRRFPWRPLAGTLLALGLLMPPWACAKASRHDQAAPDPKAAPTGGAMPLVKTGAVPAAKAGAVPAAKAGAAPAAKAGAAPAEEAGRLLVRTARITLRPRDVATTARQLERLAERHGGYVHEGALRADGERTRWQGVLKVPPGQLGATLAALRTLGRVEAESLSTEEITAAVLDVAARLRSLRTAERRYQELATQRAGSINDLVAVERELTRLRSEIERLEATARQHARALAWATVHVRLVPPPPRRAQPGPWNRISVAFTAGLRHLRDTVVALAVVLGHLWPLGLLLLGLAIAIYRLRRLLARLARALFGAPVASLPPGNPTPPGPMGPMGPMGPAGPPR